MQDPRPIGARAAHPRVERGAPEGVVQEAEFQALISPQAHCCVAILPVDSNRATRALGGIPCQPGIPWRPYPEAPDGPWVGLGPHRGIWGAVCQFPGVPGHRSHLSVVPTSQPEAESSLTPEALAAEVGTEQGLIDEIRQMHEYEAMSVEELESERARLNGLLVAALTPIHYSIYKRGGGLYLGPTSSGFSFDHVPVEYRDMLTSFHYSGGIDGMYLTVIEPSQHPVLYQLRDTCAVLASLEHEKKVH